MSLDSFIKVGDNTNPNLYPLIMGKHLVGDWKDLLLKPLDDLNFIFKDYEKQGLESIGFILSFCNCGEDL